MYKKNFSSYKILGALLCFSIFLFSGCGIEVQNIGEQIQNTAGDKIQEQLQKSQDEAVNVWENIQKEKEVKKAEDVIEKGISQGGKEKIDKWIEDNGLNKYGDQKNLMYAGGTPLFNEATGEITDRYEYILKNHPELTSEAGIE